MKCNKRRNIAMRPERVQKDDCQRKRRRHERDKESARTKMEEEIKVKGKTGTMGTLENLMRGRKAT